MKKLIIVILIMFQLAIECETTFKARMEPDSIELMEGDELRIRCNLTDKGDDETIKGLNFQKGGKQIDEKYVTRNINNGFIELVMKNMTESSMIFCIHNVSRLAYTDVRVGPKPANVTDFKCIANNWNNLTCTFRKPFNPIPVHYTITYTTDQTRDIQYSCTDVTKFDNGSVSCYIRSSAYRRTNKIFYFTVVANNSLGINTQNFPVNNYAIVLPNAIEELKVSDITSKSASVSWKIPVDLKSFPYNFDVQFSLSCKYPTDNTPPIIKETLPPNKIDYVINLPYAHTEYNISITMKSEVANDEYWSEWSEKVSFKSSPRRPDDPPGMAKGGFNYGPTGEFIYVYWQHLSEQYHNGDDFKYIVHSNDTATPNATKITQLYAVFKNKLASHPFTITVQSKNEQGLSERSSSMMIPSEKNRVSPPKKLVKTLNNGVYNITWVPPMTDKDDITDYTVFWCSAKSELPNNCDSSINFTYRKPNETFFVQESNLTMNFAISANTKDSSSGMIWSSCTAANSHDIGKIKTIWPQQVAATKIDIKWKLECTDSGTVVGYQIEYCPIKEPKTLQCEELVKKVNTTSQKHTFENLQPYKSYKFNVRMFSSSTMGPPSEPQVYTTLEAAPSTIRNPIALLVGLPVILVLVLVTANYFYNIYRRMRNIFPEMPPGFEDYIASLKIIEEKLEKDKIEPEDRTLQNSENSNGSSHKLSQSNSVSDSAYGSEKNHATLLNYKEKKQVSSLKQFIINPTTGEEIALGVMPSKITFTSPKPINSTPLPASSSGYTQIPLTQMQTTSNPQSNPTIGGYVKPVNLMKNLKQVA